VTAANPLARVWQDDSIVAPTGRRRGRVPSHADKGVASVLSNRESTAIGATSDGPDANGTDRAAPPAVRILGVERAARVLHARAVTRHGRVSGPEVVDIVERETGAGREELLETTNRVLDLFEGLDASPDPEPHTVPAPFTDVAPLYQSVAAALGHRIGRHIVIVCSHRRPIEEAPEWCLARGSFLLLADRRSQGGHPAG
jgi:hypothetical protein